MGISYRLVHVPKTGGRAIALALGVVPRRHVPAGVTREELQVLEEPWGDFLFGFVRNPYDRILSGYAFREGSMPFERWVLGEGIEIGMREDKVFRPMCFYLNAPVGFVGRFESLEEDFGRLTRILGVEAKLERVGASQHAPWQEVYTPAMKKRIYSLYEQDFLRFGYAE